MTIDSGDDATMILRNLCRTAFVLLSALSAMAPALAWGPVGHEVVAQIAYDNLKPNVKAKVNAILAADPRGRSLADASTWPDSIRHSNKVPASEIHASEHYVNVPLTNGTLPPPPERATYYVEPETVTIGIADNATVLADGSSKPQERADALSWLIHLVGDIHQPLHCVARITDEHPLPHGDQGGNLYSVRAPHITPSGNIGVRKTSLHAYWDSVPSMLDLSATPQQLAAAIEKSNPIASCPSPDNASPKDAAIWANESCELALTVYATPENEQLTDEYIAASKAIARDRLARAGYRLAGLLNALLKDTQATGK